MSHLFIFTPSIWIGEGKISITGSTEFIKFYTKWTFVQETTSKIKGTHIVEMQDVSEHVINAFDFSAITSHSFNLQMRNDIVGTIDGTGVIEPKVIAWEFRQSTTFEGFEVYELQENEDYLLHAEYASPDQIRTIIEGRIWKKG